MDTLTFCAATCNLFIIRTLMQMEPRIETIREKKLVGKRLSMSLMNNKTPELWRSFMPHRNKIENTAGPALYSLQVYSPAYFNTFNPGNTFEKWAAIEVTAYGAIPDGMETFTLPQGRYAVFHYKGSSADASIYQYIFNTWLPGSGYVLDHRPHFELLGDAYKNADPDSEEDIYIPITTKP